MDRYRRSILDRTSEAWKGDKQLSALVEAYEGELRVRSLIDFDDMPLLALKALAQNLWLQRAVLAKYPILVVDEYQDLGFALHSIVMRLCFQTGIRLLAVGDVDQSIYGFTGANPSLLEQLSHREDVETVRLRFNYRCGSRIVTASKYALGEERDYQAPADAQGGAVYFHPVAGTYEAQAEVLFSQLLPEAVNRHPDLRLDQVAILYPAAWIGDKLVEPAERHGFETLRTDGNALYPRSSRLMRWLESCAAWCCEGWQSGEPRFSAVVRDGYRLFGEALSTDEQRSDFRRRLLQFLWEHRDGEEALVDWLDDFAGEVLDRDIARCRTLDDESETLAEFIEQLMPGGHADGMTLAQFSGQGTGLNQLNLSTLHSAKGREFALVFLFGMDDGRIPRNNATPRELREARRLFYVGVTRAGRELHVIYTSFRPSPFVAEVRQRLQNEAQ
jgi:DNA helicase-2/ATP-dependent DNA helicase PcrA